MKIYSGSVKIIGGPLDGMPVSASNWPIGKHPVLGMNLMDHLINEEWIRPIYDLQANGDALWTGEYHREPAEKVE